MDNPCAASPIPREARDGLMRAWLAILRDKHPEVTWIAVEQSSETQSPTKLVDSVLKDAQAVDSEFAIPVA